MPFIYKKTKLDGVFLIERKQFIDERGSFSEIFKKSDFILNNIKYDFLQDNISISNKNVLRGLHFQKSPYMQGKFVNILKGKVYDVIVDIRKNSNTFMKWEGFYLSDKNNLGLFIPPGFAHGFVCLSNNTIFHYKCTEEYNKDLDIGIRWNDKDINIKWPVQNPILSEKDKNLPFLKDLIL